MFSIFQLIKIYLKITSMQKVIKLNGANAPLDAYVR